MTKEDSTRPPDAAPQGRTVDGSQLCGAPYCGRTLADHMPDNGNDGRVIEVSGVIVGSRACAIAFVNACPVCGRSSKHRCTQPGPAINARLKTQLALPAPSTKAAA